MAKKPKPELKRRIQRKESDVLDFLTSLGQGSSSQQTDDLSAITGDNAGLPSVVGGTARDFDLEKLFDEVKKDLGAMPRDLKFDDSSLPCAANFYEWCTGRDFLSAEPYLEQVLIGVRLFSEYCPHCSNTHWMQIENHEPQEGLAGLRRNVVLLRNGVCPKCGAKRSNLMAKKELPVYNELGVLAGQRCVTGDTRLVSSEGIVRFKSLVSTTGHSKNADAPHLHNSIQSAKPNLFYKALNQKLHRLVLSNGYVLDATASHHVGTEHGQIALSHIGVGTRVKLQLGQHLYGHYCFGVCEELSITDVLDGDLYRAAGTALATHSWGEWKTRVSQLALRCTDKHKLAAEDFVDGSFLGRAVMSARMYEQKEFLTGLFKNGPFVTLTKDVAYDVYAIASNMGICTSLQGNGDRVTISCYDLTPRPLHEIYVNVVACEPTDLRADVYDVHMPRGNQYISDGIKHHNSGKSIVVAMLSTYMTHRILKMQRPTKVYNVGDNQLLHGTFVALTKDQAKDTLWEPYYGYLLESPWFQRYHALIKRYEGIYGIDVLKIRDTFVLYRHRNLIVYFAGPDKRVLRGRTRVFYAIDEIGWFDNDAAKNSIKTGAKEVSIALERSCLTVRASEMRLIKKGVDDFLSAYGFNVSSPSDYRDKICEIVRQSRTSNKILGIHAPTWKMNPNITRETLDEEYRKDPVAAARDYGAEPPVSANPFITPQTVDQCKREKSSNGVKYTEHVERSRGVIANSVDRTRYGRITKIKKGDRPSILAMDAGETNNSFALACGSMYEGKPRVDLLVEIMPLPGIPLNYTLIFDNVIARICKERNVKIMLADRWNSTKLLQDAQLLELVEFAKKYSLKYSDMWDVKNQMQDGSLTYPTPQFVPDVEALLNMDVSDYPACFAGKPVEHFMYQCITIQDSGRGVLKGTGVTDDLWRATALMTWGLSNPDYADLMRHAAKQVNQNRDPSRLAVLRTPQSQYGQQAGSRAGQVGNFPAIIKSRTR